MEALGLVQHIDQLTHQLGNTLDHIYTESIDTLGISHAFTSNYILDHKMVGIELNIKKQLEQPGNEPRQPFKNLTLQDFKTEFNNSIILQHSTLEDIYIAFTQEINRTLDKLVPPKNPRKQAKPARPWYNTRLLGQRRIVRNRENTYWKYKVQHQWRAFTRE